MSQCTARSTQLQQVLVRSPQRLALQEWRTVFFKGDEFPEEIAAVGTEDSVRKEEDVFLSGQIDKERQIVPNGRRGIGECNIEKQRHAEQELIDDPVSLFVTGVVCDSKHLKEGIEEKFEGLLVVGRHPEGAVEIGECVCDFGSDIGGFELSQRGPGTEDGVKLKKPRYGIEVIGLVVIVG